MTKEKTDFRYYSKDVFCLFGLLIRCPLGSSKLGCPLNSLRQSVGLEEKLNYAKKLGESERSQIIEYHQKCFSKRLGYVGN